MIGEEEMDKEEGGRKKVYVKWNDELAALCKELFPMVRKEMLRRKEEEEIDLVKFYLIVKREIQKFLGIFDWEHERLAVKKYGKEEGE